MFGKNKNNNNSNGDDSVNAVIHTMQDDIDGKSPTQISSPRPVSVSGGTDVQESSNTIEFSSVSKAPAGLDRKITPKIPVSSMPAKQSSGSSPFLSSPTSSSTPRTNSTPRVSGKQTHQQPQPTTTAGPTPKMEKVSALLPEDVPAVGSLSFSDNKPQQPVGVAQKATPTTSDTPIRNNPAQTPSSSLFPRILLGTLVLIIILAAGAGGYYFWTTRYADTPAVVDIPDTTPSIDDLDPIDVVDTTEPDTNILTIYTETATSESILSDLIRLDENISSGEVGEISVFDGENNSPLSFSIFSFLSAISLPSEVFPYTDERFSLYSVSDSQGVLHHGFSVDVTDPELASASLLASEDSLVGGILPLYGTNPPTVLEQTFSDGLYNDVSIRYTNFSEDGALSLDYAFVGNRLVVATSKESMRLIIDHILSVQWQTFDSVR
ncbi:MAG: hypothetical protein KC736_02475 [Candidatus Moranbacteria bacterium]|nr:hypothetical protein [Candidatus Moranbacteria bacterium]